MPRIARLINPGEETCYHVMSRTALNGLPFGDADNDELLRIMKHFSTVYFTEILGFCLMGKHILLKMFPGGQYSDEEINERYIRATVTILCFHRRIASFFAKNGKAYRNW